MPVFVYQGKNRAGTKVSGEQSASTKAELAALLRRQQINVTKMSEKGKEFVMPSFGSGVKSNEIAIFTRQFSVMIDAGLPLVQCLEILGGQQENKTFQKVLLGTRGAVEGGATLSAAMRQYDKIFDNLYVNMVEAGETGGILDTIQIGKSCSAHAARSKAELRFRRPCANMTKSSTIFTSTWWKPAKPAVFWTPFFRGSRRILKRTSNSSARLSRRWFIPSSCYLSPPA